MPDELEEDELEFDKCVGQFRLRLGYLLKPLQLYGQGVYVDSVLEEIVSLGVQLHLKLYGIEMPYHVNNIHW